MDFNYNIRFLACLFMIGFFFVSCDKPKSNAQRTKIDYSALAKTLSSNEAKIGYLQGIESLDKETKKATIDALQKFGFESENHKKAKAEQVKAEKENIEKIEAFLNAWGYPNKRSLKINAADIVINLINESEDIDVVKRNFNHIYTAYSTDRLPGSKYTKYLNQYYQLATGESMNIPNPFTEAFEVDTLMRSLKLK